MKIVECVICKKKNVRFFCKKNEKLTSDFQENWDLIYKHQCQNCNQTTVKMKNRYTNKINSLWLEFYIKNKSIQKKISIIEKEIKTLNNDKNNSSVKKKVNQLIKNFEDSKIKKESLKHTMLASISIQLRTLL